MTSHSKARQKVHTVPQDTPAGEEKTVRQIDAHVGGKIRERRILLGYTQQQMANLIGVTYQQAHKYERGINRISAGRLYSIAFALNVPISYFYEGLSPTDTTETTSRQRMCLEMARNFSQIENERYQDALSHLTRALSQTGTH
ncbi:helix-turn-helix domain-containing protein [Sneathiella chinensis]|uniref:Transcriptional regulator n=1 Tax=Sneathiella chinensis TaxID=349750 RepID=A0ABQ5U578_9PROT|nr:helix-turn-helix transcriptional regulator [Sneathiella chinensis]GLQ05621.1 transcriptional regulator [Sneathiella chinensis]